jgi:hypothetical protein
MAFRHPHCFHYQFQTHQTVFDSGKEPAIYVDIRSELSSLNGIFGLVVLVVQHFLFVPVKLHDATLETVRDVWVWPSKFKSVGKK